MSKARLVITAVLIEGRSQSQVARDYGLCFWGAVVVAWLTYLGALAAAVTYGQLIRTTFDVHRGLLLAQLDLVEEPGLWPRLAQHWYRGIPMDVKLEPDEPDERTTDSGGPALALGSLLLMVALAVGLAGALILA